MYKRVMVVALLASLAGCKVTQPSADVPLTNMPSVSYKLPLDQSVDISFNAYNRCVNSGSNGCTKYDSIKFGRKAGNVVVERRVHNGVAGSGSVYTINETTERTSDSSIVTYQPVKMSSYQQGLLLPFPIPKMDIANYLSNTQFKKKFELNSEYPSQSVKANFDRMMNKARSDFRFYGTNSRLDLEDYYMVDVDGAKVVMLVETFPYRNGSKVVVNAVVQTHKSNTGIIDVAAIMKSVEEQVSKVINS
ncbi:hypothetical protein [Shewanella colwelliana]|uniref:hypothetical protein n=1 Tax=Shewanella colwelliana TaxID=23 RepID=UPI0022B0272E|nr:hypothetical protein [Shewanella colwelliana]MCZ4337636.1 hypothetical protein [Shewanella colwelliana]